MGGFTHLEKHSKKKNVFFTASLIFFVVMILRILAMYVVEEKLQDEDQCHIAGDDLGGIQCTLYIGNSSVFIDEFL